MRKNPYTQLLGNTFIFAIGTFASKVLVFLMMRYYTAVLSAADFGVSDLITQAANVLIPLATASITAGIIRFGLDQANDKRAVFSIGVATVFCGYLVLLLLGPLLGRVSVFGEHLPLIYLYVLTASLQQVCHQFVRARGRLKLYALDGIFRTVCTIGLNVFFLSGLELGVTGYVLSIIVSDALSVVLLGVCERLPRFFGLRFLDPHLARAMLRYSLPLIFAAECNWIISMSDRFFIEALRPADELGLYAVAARIPTMMLLVSSIFIDAWQISTLDGRDKPALAGFFTTVGNLYQALIAVLVSGILLCDKLLVYLLADPSYFSAWRFIPFLAVGAGFACLSNFVGSIYTLEKKSAWSMATILLGAGLNVALNLLLIPGYGPQGAAFATAVSYAAMFLLRAVHSRRYLAIRWQWGRAVGSLLLLGLQCAVLLREGALWLPAEILLFLAVLALNGADITKALRKTVEQFLPRRDAP